MSANDDIKRQLGVGMPTQPRNIADERYSVTHTSHVKPEPQPLLYRFYGAEILVNDGTGWRTATSEEVEQLMGGVTCMKPQRNLFTEIKEGFDALQEKRASGVAIGATSPELLPPGTLYFNSVDDFIKWHDKEDGSLD